MPPLDVAHQSGPIVVTLAYVLLYYAFQVNLVRVKSALSKEYAAKGEKFDRYFGQDRRMLAADRVQLNTLEHMGPFLALLWLNAVFVGPFGATVAGGIYVVARAAYPFALGARVGRGPRALVFASTMPGYVVIGWFVGALAWALVTA